MISKQIRMALITCAGLLSVMAAAAQNTKTTTVVFETLKHDFGTIREVDGDVSFTFRFTNEGQLPFVINRVNVSCGCTTPSFSREPVLPGRDGEIRVTFDPTNRPGRFEKVVSLLSNADRQIDLIIVGEVIPRPRTIQDDYPYSIRDGLRIADKAYHLPAVARTRRTVQTVGVANGGSQPVRVGVEASGLPGWVTVKPRKETLAPGERSEIEVTLDPARGGELWGKHTFAFPLVVNGARQPEQVEITAILVEDFSGLTPEQVRRAPQADFSSFFYHFSDQPRGKQLKREFQITNSGRDDLIIRHMGPSGSRIKAMVDKTTVKPGDTATLVLTLDTSGASGRVAEGVTVVTNDPVRPARDIRVLATVQ